jgi:hypothetical protein
MSEDSPDRTRAVGVFVLVAVLLGLVLLYLRGEAVEESTQDSSEIATSSGDDSTSAEPSPSRSRSSERGSEARSTRRPLRLSPAVSRQDRSARFGVLAGHVLSWSTNEPVAGAEVTFEVAGQAVTEHTDRDGAFEYYPRRATEHTLSIVTARGYHPYAPDWETSPITFRPEPWQRVEGIVVYLVPALDYTGLVVSAEGEPVAGARIRLLETAAAEQALMPPTENAWESGADGTFTFHAADGALFEARHPEHGRGRARLDFAAQASHRLRIELTTDARPAMMAARIEGRVEVEDGTPLPEATVFAVPRPDNEADPSAQLHPIGSAFTDEEGHFAIEGIDVGPHSVSTSVTGYATARAEIEAPADDVVLVVSEEALLTGKVSDAETGAPLASSTIVVERETGPLSRRVVATATTFASDGGFAVHGLSAGSYLVRATAHGYAASEPRPVLVEPGDPTDMEIALGRGATISGVVTSGEGGPGIAGARVTLEGALGADNSAVPILVSAVTRDDGGFTLTGVPPGSRSVFVAARDHHGRVISGIAATEGGTVELTIDLTPTEEGEEPQIELAGIGAVLSAHDDGLIIGRVVEGGGAAEAGLVPDDVILSVDGVRAVDLGFGPTIERIRGPEGSTVRLRVRRAGTEREEDIVVSRKRIRA